MTKGEKIEITERAAALIREWKRPVILQLSISQVVGLIAVVQLALRHPAAVDSLTCIEADELIRDLIKSIDPFQGSVYQLLMMGFDPANDADAREPSEPDVDDSVKCCPNCERPNQFGELCIPFCIEAVD